MIEEPGLRLIEEGPEVSHHRRREHHRDQDHRSPEAVAAELAVDEIGEQKAQHRLDDDGGDDEARRHLHVALQILAPDLHLARIFRHFGQRAEGRGLARAAN